MNRPATTLINIFKAFDASGLRQRILVAAAILVFVHAAWDVLLYQPQLRQLDTIGSAIDSHRTAIAAFGKTIQKINIVTSQDKPNTQITTLNTQIRQLDAQIEMILSELITPDQMSDVLRELLTKNTSLKLTQLDTEAAKLVNKSVPEGDTGSSAEPIYKHAMTLQFEGDYLSALSYIQAVEQLGWRIFWDSVHIDGSDYPRTRISVSLYTLSLDEGWIGV